MGASDTLETNILNHFFRGVSTTANSSCYVALFLTDPTDAGTGTEVSGTGYARKAVTFCAPSQVGGKAVIANTNKVEYDTPASAWGTVAYWAIYTAATGGTLLSSGVISPAKTIAIGDPPFFNIGALTVSLD